MDCPVCRVPLTMSERQGIEIDYCPQCRGVWLDRGELDKILERSASAPAAPREAAAPPVVGDRDRYRGDQDRYRSDHDRHRDDHEYHRHKRRKNWLEEIFD